MTPPTIFILVLIAWIAGVVLFAIGWRGRRVNDHPICRRCGFDLFGRPPDATVCAECGATLDHPRAIRSGARRRRMGTILVGTVMLLCAASATGTAGWIHARRIDITPYKPVWWLLNDTASNDATRRDVALKELLDRQAAGKLSRSQTRSVIAHALRWQGDLSKPWLDAWGRFINTARAAHMLDDDQWQTYARQAFVLRMQTRPRAARGELLPIRLDSPFPRGRCTSDGKGGLSFDGSIQYFIDGSPIPMKLVDGVDWDHRKAWSKSKIDFFNVGEVEYHWLRIEDVLANSLRDGEHTLSVILDGTVEYFYYDENDKEHTQRVAHHHVELRQHWNLLPRGKSSVQVLSPSDHPDIGASVIKAVEMNIWREPRLGAGAISLEIAEPHQRPSVDLSYRIFAVSGNREWPISRVLVEASSEAYIAIIEDGNIGDFKGDTIDVVLRPDPWYATRYPPMNRIWGGTLTFHNVRIERESPIKY